MESRKNREGPGAHCSQFKNVGRKGNHNKKKEARSGLSDKVSEMNLSSLEERQKIYKLAVEHWGVQPQILKAVEELAELTQALCKVSSLLTREYSLEEIEHFSESEDLVSELADVRNMVEQIELIFQNADQVRLAQSFKMTRTLRRIQFERGENDGF